VVLWRNSKYPSPALASSAFHAIKSGLVSLSYRPAVHAARVELE
jgi:hypothetical protein